MSIQWGSYESSGGVGLRVGIQIESVTTPVNGSTTFVVTFSVWTQNTGPYADNQSIELTSNKTLSDDSVPYFNGESTTATKRGPNQTATHTYTTYGTSPGTVSITAEVAGAFNGVTPSKTVSVTIPARPWADPASPTSLTNTRVSDTQASLSWTNNSTASALYAGTRVQRQTDGGSWSSIATPGVVTSYSDTTIVANHKYNHRVSAIGANGSEVGYATGTAFWTTPGAPTSCTATKLGSGNIQVDWSNTVNYSEYQTEIYESQDGGAFTLLTTVASGVASYEHVAPSTGVTHTYKVRAKTSSGTELFSAYSGDSNTIVLLDDANPPTGLAPSGVARDATEAITFAWTHNPTDGTPQSQYQLQYKVDAGGYTTVGPTSSATASYELPAATLTNGHTITWRVATAGENGTFSAYSAESTFTTSARPTATISTPTGGAYSLSTLTVEWTYYQEQSSAQATWQASLYDDADQLLEQISGTTQAEGTFTTALADGATYTVTVTVVSAAGLSSAADSEEFTVSYLPPADVTIDAAYDPDSGCMVLTVTGDDPVEDVTEPIDTVDIQRRINGGAWVTIATGLVLSGDPLTVIVLDTAPTIAGTNTYRAVAHSALPSSATSAETDNVTDESWWAFLSTGDGFATIVRVKTPATSTAALARARALHHFAGRPKPVQLTGEATDLVLSISTTLTADSSPVEDVEALAATPGVVLWRDSTGRRVFGSLTGVSTGRGGKRFADVSFTVVEVDHAE